MVKFIARIVLELLIAVVIFIALINFIPLFDAQVTEKPLVSSSGGVSVLPKRMFDQVDTVFAGVESSVLRALEEEPSATHSVGTTLIDTSPATIAATVTVKKSCNLPRSKQKIGHGKFVTAYKNDTSDGENVCEGEIRICDDGILLGGYSYQTCSYTIDGINRGKEVVPGATQTQHNLFTFIKGENSPKEFIQPERYTYPPYKKNNDYRYNLRGQRIEKKTIYNENVSEDQRQKILATYEQMKFDRIKPEKNFTYRISPRGSKIAHGDTIIAYKKSIEESAGKCLFEKRPCIDGRLLGGFTAQYCRNRIQKIIVE